jgi:phosphate-selective porin OprO and OprP
MARIVSWVVAAALAAAPLSASDEEKPRGSPVVATASADGFSLQSEDGGFKLQLRGLVQFDGRFFLADADGVLNDTFLVRRARPILEGVVARRFEFNLTPDFAGGSAVIQNAYVGFRSKVLSLRLGKFKPPIGLEHLQADQDLLFLERALPSGLGPNRDVGLQLGGELAKGRVSCAAGVFNGTPDGASADLNASDGESLVARVVLSPFKGGASPLKGLSLGVGASTERQSASTAVAGYRTGGLNTFFSYASGVAPAGRRTRWAPELAFFGGPVGLLAEYARSEAELSRTATSPAGSYTTGPLHFANDAWQVAGSVVLTGDHASFKGPTIARPFDPEKHQWGALQLVARVNGFTADAASFSRGFADSAKSARRAFAWAVGLSWFLTKNLKQAASYERTTFTGGASRGGDRPPENALLIRSELRF